MGGWRHLVRALAVVIPVAWALGACTVTPGCVVALIADVGWTLEGALPHVALQEGAVTGVREPSPAPDVVPSAAAVPEDPHGLVEEPGKTLKVSSLPPLPADWEVTAFALGEVTGDGSAEWVLLVWRPWRDWPIQRWSSAPSPIAGFHDAAGDSCHLILIDPADGHQIWAGSALPVPLVALSLQDVDEDGDDEVVVLEGSYATGRGGTGAHVDVWEWNGFGFTLAWRSPSGTFGPHCLVRADKCGIDHIALD